MTVEFLDNEIVPKRTVEFIDEQPITPTPRKVEFLDPIKTETISEYHPSFYEKTVKPMLQELGFIQTPMERVAQAQNIYAEAKYQATKLSNGDEKRIPDLTTKLIPTIRDNWDDYVESEYNLLTPKRTNERMTQILLSVPLAPALIEAPIATMAGIATFAGTKAVAGATLYPAIKFITNKIQKMPYSYNYVENPAELLPEDATQASKDMVDLIELFGLGGIASGVGRKAPAILEGLTKETMTKYNLPKNVFISPEKIKDVFQTGTKMSPEELDLYSQLNLNGAQVREAVKNGISVSVPLEKAVSLVDKPYWKKAKEIFGIRPEEVSVKEKIGEVKEATKSLPAPQAQGETQVSTGATQTVAMSVQPEITGGGETKVRGLARGVEEKAIENKLTESLGTLPEYQAVNMKEQAAKSMELLTSDPLKAKRIAMGDELPPNDILPESVFTAVENKAIKEGDINTIRDLATSSGLTVEATTMGQRIRALAERDPESPVVAIKDIAQTREQVAQKKFKTNNFSKTKKLEVENIRSEIKKISPKKEDWASFIKSLQC